MPPDPPPTGRRAPSLRDWLRAAARKANRNPRRTAAHVVALGRLLLDARGRLGPGKFGRWIRTLDFSVRTGQEAMTAARRCGGLPDLARLLPSALRVLTRPAVRADADLVARIVRATGRRGRVGFSAAREAVTDVDPAAVYGPAGVPVASETEDEAFARRLLNLVAAPGVSALMISVDRDPQCPTAEIRLMGLDRRVFTRPTLRAALAAATGEEPLRRCPKCSRDKGEDVYLPPQMFSEGCSQCRFCKRKNTREWKRRRQAKGGGQGT